MTVTGPAAWVRRGSRCAPPARPAAGSPTASALPSWPGCTIPDLLPHTVASCLGLPEQDARAQADAVVDYLRGRQLLLILDTCEHLIGACADLAEADAARRAPGDRAGHQPAAAERAG